jgi:hypothetical protein
MVVGLYGCRVTLCWVRPKEVNPGILDAFHVVGSYVEQSFDYLGWPAGHLPEVTEASLFM